MKARSCLLLDGIQSSIESGFFSTQYLLYQEVSIISGRHSEKFRIYGEHEGDIRNTFVGCTCTFNPKKSINKFFWICTEGLKLLLFVQTVSCFDTITPSPTPLSLRCSRCLPCTENKIDNMIHGNSMFH